MKSDNKNKVYACFISLLNFIFACFRVVETMARNTSNDRETTSAFWSLWQDHERCWMYGGQFGKSCITSRQFSTTFPQPTRPRKSYRRTQGTLILSFISLLGSANTHICWEQPLRGDFDYHWIILDNFCYQNFWIQTCHLYLKFYGQGRGIKFRVCHTLSILLS